MSTDEFHHDAWEDPSLSRLLAQNRRWVELTLAKDPTYFEKLGAGQSPHYLYIGCSDSRVPANEIMGLRPGEVFVHRNIANLVPSCDLNVHCVIQYAVEVLKVQHIIVTGHYDCGGIRAAMRKNDHGLIEHWLRNIRDVYRLHQDLLDSITDPEARHRKLVEVNVVEQCLNLYKTGIVQRRRLETWKATGVAWPRIHALAFNPAEGVLHKLPVNFKEEIDKHKHIYDLYPLRSENESTS
jgi:carbonic anhydrase